MLIAITRPVSASFAECQLTHLARQPIDVVVAERQHAEYERALEAAGCVIHRLPPAPDLPDAVFVEDAAIVLDEVAIATRPGAESRRPEVATVASALASWRPVVCIEAPGTIDGGDVLRVGRRLFVGQSGRTNASGFEQLKAIAARFGYLAEPVTVTGCLHLKSAVTQAEEGTVLLNPGAVCRHVFERRRQAGETTLDGLEVIETDAVEPAAANGLLAGGRFIYAAAFPRTADRLRAHGIEPVLIDLSEMAKAEGAVTCCSVIVAVQSPVERSEDRL